MTLPELLDTLTKPENLAVVALFAALGVVLYLVRTYAVTWTPESKLQHKPSMRLQRCDCGADTKCPQGRDPTQGDPYRCKIWIEDRNDY